MRCSFRAYLNLILRVSRGSSELSDESSSTVELLMLVKKNLDLIVYEISFLLHHSIRDASVGQILCNRVCLNAIRALSLQGAPRLHSRLVYLLFLALLDKLSLSRLLLDPLFLWDWGIVS